MNKHIPISVAFKKKTGNKVWVKTFTDQRTPDRILAARGTLLPPGSEIIELGVGSQFEERYKQKYG